MIRSLRRRHLQVWLLWAFLLPAGVISAWWVIPKNPRTSVWQPGAAAVLPVVTATADQPAYTVRLRCTTDSSRWQLEWINKTILTVPSAVIYRSQPGNTDIRQAVLIGRIEATGHYVFDLGTEKRNDGDATAQWFLYDFIHQQVIDTIKF